MKGAFIPIKIKFMSGNLYFYSPLPVKALEEIVAIHQKDFDEMLEDSFTEEELSFFEKQIDSIAAIYVQPVLSELTFEDFYADESDEDNQRKFFDRCKSTITLENVPYYESNAFQISYIQNLLAKIDEVLIDRGGVSELQFKTAFLNDLKKYRSLDQIQKPAPKKIEIKTTRPVDPIDFLIQDVYKEIQRLSGKDINPDGLPPKIIKILEVMKAEQLNADQLLRKCALGAKEFDDGLERLKFWLRRFYG